MYRAFKISANEVDKLPETSVDSIPDFLREDKEEEVRRFLTSKILDRENALDGNEIQKEWFPTYDGKYQVFISHSHKDMDRARKLRDFFESCGISCFVDSYVWGSADELINRLNKEYNQIDDNTFGHERGLFIASHVYNILLNAIHQVIDKCECFIYLEPKDEPKKELDIFSTTLSPWIYSELRLVSIIRCQVPLRLEYERRSREGRIVCGADVPNKLDIEYRVDTSNFVELTADYLRIVRTAEKLDLLYSPVRNGRFVEHRMNLHHE